MYRTYFFSFKPSKSRCVQYTDHLIHGLKWKVSQISPSENPGASYAQVRSVYEQIRYIILPTSLTQLCFDFKFLINLRIVNGSGAKRFSKCGGNTIYIRFNEFVTHSFSPFPSLKRLFYLALYKSQPRYIEEKSHSLEVP